MITLTISFFAAAFSSLSNFFFRKCVSERTLPHVYLLFFYLVSFLLSFIIQPKIFSFPFNGWMALVGSMVGILNVGLMLLTSKALQSGPAGLTYAFQNASAVFPNFLLFILFGPAFGFVISLPQVIGMTFVLLGLFVGAVPKDSSSSSSSSKRWIFFASILFFLQMLALTIIQWRCLLFENIGGPHILIPFSCTPEADMWFMPGFFATAFILQSAIVLKKRVKFTFSEISNGFF